MEGQMGRFGVAWKAFWRILGSSEAAERWLALVRGAQVEPAARPAEAPAGKPGKEISADAVYTLVLLQREGRLVDFLQEDIEAYGDEQVGAAVRQIHAGCRKVLAEHFALEAIRAEPEGSRVQVPRGFDPGEIRLTGAVAGEAPFNGTLRHRGWRVTKVDFPERHANLDPALICPAEVEIG
jgi:hypothetical protein